MTYCNFFFFFFVKCVSSFVLFGVSCSVLHCCYILSFRSEIITRWLAAMAKVGTVVIGRYFVVDVKLVESVVLVD